MTNQNPSQKTPASKVNLLAQMKGKPFKSAVVVLALAFFFWLLIYPDPLAKMLMGSNHVLPASVYWLLRLEVALLALFLASRLERIQDDIHYALSWANSVGMMRYGIACIAAAFVITAWSLGDFPNVIFGGASSNYWLDIYLYIQLYAFFGLAAAGVCLVALVNLIEIRYDFSRKNDDFLHPYKFIAAKVEEWKREPQNNLLNTDDFSDLHVTSWNVKADEKTIEYELARRLLKEKDGLPEAGKLGKWVLYKVVIDFKGRIRGIQRYEADDYQKIRYT
jgi:hypothetical protein